MLKHECHRWARQQKSKADAIDGMRPRECPSDRAHCRSDGRAPRRAVSPTSCGLVGCYRWGAWTASMGPTAISMGGGAPLASPSTASLLGFSIQLPNGVSIKALRFEVAGRPLWSEALDAVYGTRPPFDGWGAGGWLQIEGWLRASRTFQFPNEDRKVALVPRG